jgi:hypothetical protein
VRIHAPEPPQAPGAPVPPAPPVPKVTKPDDAGVKIDEKGVRIFSNKDGEKVAVVVDEKGVRVERLPRDAPSEKKGEETGAAEGAITIESDGRTITIPPDIAQDPVRLARPSKGARSDRAIVEDRSAGRSHAKSGVIARRAATG